MTQKVCEFVRQSPTVIPTGEEAAFVENLVRSRVIENWESQDEPEHFRTIQDRILKRNEQKAAYLLDLYQQVWHSDEIDIDSSIEQSDLQLAGIVVKQENKLKVYNLIYQTIFNNLWIEKTLGSLRPYAENYRQWILLGKQDDSRLLRGNALVEASIWARDKSLGFQDQEFLAASRTLQEKEELAETKRQAELEIERKEKEAAERAREIEVEAEQKAEKQLESASSDLESLKITIDEINQSIAKIRELSAVASQLQQKGEINEANQFLNIAGVVLQDKINNYQMKEALLNSGLVLGYQYLANAQNEQNKIKDLENAKVNFNKSLKQLLIIESQIGKTSDNLVTLVHFNYVKGKLEEPLDKTKAVQYYKKAIDYINELQSNVDLFTLDLNILYNGNANIVALLYRQLKELDGSTTGYYAQLLKKHLLNELDYLMQQQRWREADSKNWQFILYSAGKEKQGYLDLTDVKNFNCKDLKQLNAL